MISGSGSGRYRRHRPLADGTVPCAGSATYEIWGHMNIRGPQLFYSFFIRWMKVVCIGALFADWSCAL